MKDKNWVYKAVTFSKGRDCRIKLFTVVLILRLPFKQASPEAATTAQFAVLHLDCVQTQR